MNIFDVLTLVGGLCLFLFGMNIMGDGLERRAGGKLQSLLGKLTSGRIAGLLTGIGVTAVIQSSSATTVMVVGFVNSGLMTLKQAINVIMGANIGTTVTSWILSLGGIDSGNLFLKLLKPTSFTPILALIGIIFQMFFKSNKKKDTGAILLGFAVLMFGMDTMSGAVSGLADVPAFQNMFLLFKNPVLGVLAGAIITAIIQSSSASVGILQALSATGAISYGAAIPIIMGQNIGTCITAIISCFGANRNAKRAALVHLSFNVIGTAVCLGAFSIVNYTLSPVVFGESATHAGIAVCHSIFNIISTLLLLPMSSLLEKLAYKLVPESKTPEKFAELDERLLATPAAALERCRTVACEMADCSISAFKDSVKCLESYSDTLAERIREKEELADHYEDILGTYLVKLSTHQINDEISHKAAMYLKVISDFERISDHAVNMLESAEEIITKKIELSSNAKEELNVLTEATKEILELSRDAFYKEDLTSAQLVEPLEEVVDNVKEQIRSRHIKRLQDEQCSITAGFVLSDLLTSYERISDHCSNIAGCLIDTAHNNLNTHETLRILKSDDSEFKVHYNYYAEKYALS